MNVDALQRFVVAKAANVIGECVRVSPCGQDTYEAQGHYWTEQVEIFEGDSPTLSTRHLLAIPMSQLDHKVRPARGDVVVVREMKFKVSKVFGNDGFTLTLQLHEGEKRLRAV